MQRNNRLANLVQSAVALLAVCWSVSLFASNTAATVSGRVVSPTNDPIAGATVTLTHQPSGTTASAVSGDSGSFYQAGLRVGGPYELKVAAADYREFVESGIYLQPGSQAPLRIPLQLDTQMEEVVVTASRVVSDRDLNNGVGSAYGTRDIANQPAIKRDVLRTVLRDPLAQSNGEGHLSVAGVNARFNALAIDGSLQQDDFGLSSNTYATRRSPINLDAIESVSLVASDYSVTATGFTGGLVNVTTKSGSNEWDGTVFSYMQNPDFVGDTYDGDRSFDTGDFDENEFGFTIGGPLIENQLFVFASVDKYESTDAQDFGAFDTNNGIKPGFFEGLRNVIQDTYGFDPGVRPAVASNPVSSERTLVKVDWNVDDRHRLAFTYQSTLEDQTSASASRLPSAWIATPTDLNSVTVQLFSDWSDQLSTTVRFNRKLFERGQNCQAGPGVGAMEIDNIRPSDLVGTPLEGLLDDEVDIDAGCDRFRHANAYDDERTQFFASADYVVGDHIWQIGFERETFDLFNLFVPSSSGRYVFNGYRALVERRARVDYVNVVSNVAADGAATWGYGKNTVFIQDTWHPMDDLELNLGARMEFFTQDDEPAYSAAIQTKYGLDSSANLDGLRLFMPRASFRWTGIDRTTISGGLGLFSGGDPKVWTSNAFQVPTVFARESSATNVSVTSVPESLRARVAAAGVGLPIDVIGEGFDVPADWKASLRVERQLDLPLLGEDVVMTAQYLHTRTQNGFLWRNLAQTDLASSLPLGVAPDGRPIYADLDAMREINLTQLTNFSAGASHITSVSLSKAFANGLDLQVSYANQNVETVTEGFSSRGISNWRNIQDADRNNPSARNSPHEVPHSVKLSLGYERDLGPVRARADLFGRVYSGDRYTFTYDISRTNALFGRAGAGESPYDNMPMYIPLDRSDSAVVYGSRFDVGGFFDYIDQHDIKPGIQRPYSNDAGLNQILDLRLQFEIPGIPQLADLTGENTIKVVLDIENVLNFLNKDWGTYENGPRYNQLGIVQADLISRADLAANGVDGARALRGDDPRTTCTTQDACVYRYRDFDADLTRFTSGPRSIYRIRLGIRIDF